MPSVRRLKKEIDTQVFEVISDCFVYSGLHPADESDEVSVIVNDAVSLRNDLIARVNNPDGKDNPKIVKKYYQQVKKDLGSGVDKLCARLSSLAKKKK